MEFKPHDYQRFAVNHVINNKACGLFLDMGLGKTVITLTAIEELLFLDEVNKVLVIAPLRVADDTWTSETMKWEHTKHLKVSKVLGPEKKRLEALSDAADIYVINRENVEWLVGLEGKKWSFDMVVIDELSSFKNSKSIRFRSLKKVRKYINRIIGLTGTPAPNTLIELWSQLYLLDGGERLGRTLGSYRDRFFSPGARNGNIIYSWNLKASAEEEIYKRIGDICVSMKSIDYLNLPDRIDNYIKVKLPDNVKTSYEALERDLILNNEIVANNSATLTGKLLQLSNGAVYNENKEIIEFHDEKLKALEDIIESANGNSVLVFYNFKHDLDRIQKRFKGVRVLSNNNDIIAWNKGNIKILAAQPASVSYGLNIQAGGHIIVWFGLTWSLELYQQANARLHRQGQKECVIVNHIVAENTIDEDVIKALESKDITQEKLILAIKARLNKGQ